MLVVFDLELTAWPGSASRNWTGPGEYPEIIQIGAVRLDAGLLEIAALDLVVKPRLNPILSDYIVRLTGLTQARIDAEGVPFAHALANFAAFSAGAAAILCNGGDAAWIARNVELAGIANPMQAMTFASLSDRFRRAAGRDGHVISSTLPEVFGFESAGQAHDGLADARAIAEALRRTMDCGGISVLIDSLTNRAARRA